MADTTQSTSTEPRKQRILSIDVFRGLTITIMGFVNYAAILKNVTPVWSQHAPDYGLTYIDLVAPFFYFAIALMMRRSIKSHIAKEGKIEAYFQQLKRYLTLMGMGFLGTLTFNEHLQVSFYMNTLSAIGLAGIICLFLITKPRILRFILAIVLMVGKNAIFLFMTTSVIGGILGRLLLLLGDLVNWPLVLIVGFVGIVINWQIGVALDKKKLYFVL